jgi:hypothetical protein
VVRTANTIEIPLTCGAVALVDAKYALWILQWNWRFIPRNDGTVGYAGRTSDKHDGGPRRTIYMHRALKDEPAGKEVDHINGYGLDMQMHNLRVTTRVENARNRGTIGGREFKGIRETKGKRWRAAIVPADGKKLHLGVFDTPEDAARAYDRAALTHHGEHARLNFPDEHAPHDQAGSQARDPQVPPGNEVRQRRTRAPRR